MDEGWKNQQERGSPLAKRIILWIALNLGRRIARLFLYPITGYFLLMGGNQKRASRLFLRRALDREPGLIDIARHIHCFAATILDRVYLLCNRYEQFDVKLHNAELVSDTLDRGTGAILLGCHLGSFEILRTLAISDRRLPVKVLMYPQHNEQLTRLFNELNPEIKESIISLGDTGSLIRAAEHVSSGGIIGILGDRVAENEKIVGCRFLGKETDFPTGPILFASMLNTPVILFFGIYRGGNRYEIHFELLSQRITMERRERKSLAKYWTEKYVRCLEHYTRQEPYNWFNFYDFWKEDEKAH